MNREVAGALPRMYGSVEVRPVWFEHQMAAVVDDSRTAASFIGRAGFCFLKRSVAWLPSPGGAASPNRRILAM